MGYLLLVLLLASQVLIVNLAAQETSRVNRFIPTPNATTFPVWLMTKVDVTKLQVDDQVRFKSDSAFLIRKTVVPPAVFYGRVVHVQRAEENEQRESRLGILVEQVKWKDSSLSLNAYIVGFGSYRVITEKLGTTRLPNWFERGPREARFEQREEVRSPTHERQRFSKPFEPDPLGPIAGNLKEVRTLDYAEKVKEVRILRTTIEGKGSTILVRPDKNIVLPKYLPVMLEQTDEL